MRQKSLILKLIDCVKVKLKIANSNLKWKSPSTFVLQTNLSWMLFLANSNLASSRK